MAAQEQASDDVSADLPALHASILEFEREWWRHAGAKEEAIRTEFALTAARYYQLLNAVIDTPAAVRHDPMLVRRLLRARDARTTARSTRAFRISDHSTSDHSTSDHSISDHSGTGPHDEESND